MSFVLHFLVWFSYTGQTFAELYVCRSLSHVIVISSVLEGDDLDEVLEME